MSKIRCIKKCVRCGNEFEASSGYVKYCSECLEEVKKEKKAKLSEYSFWKKQDRLLAGTEGIDYVIDRWNGYATKTMGGKWMNENHPGRTLEEYKREFPDAQTVCESTSRIISDNSKEFMNRPEMKKFYSDKIKGDKNPNAGCNTTEEQRRSISPFSKSFKGYVGMSEEDIDKKISEHLKIGSPDKSTTQVGYWIKKGYSEEEAKEKVHERQSTFTLDKCIAKYGDEEGLNVWRERQLKWQNSYVHLNYSRISQELFWEIYSHLDDICFFAQNDNGVKDDSGKNHEIKVKTSKSAVSLDFYYPKTNSIIEFDGDYWHSDTREYVNKHRDIDRDNSLVECGYDRILHIKEREYRNDKESTIKKCLDFLQNKK